MLGFDEYYQGTDEITAKIPTTANNSSLKIMTEELNSPYINGTVLTKLDDGNGGYYIGGTFSQVGNFQRQHVAHILADGQVDPDLISTLGDLIMRQL